MGERRVLLPGVTILARLIARVRDEAMQRLWDVMASMLTVEQARLVERLLEVPEGARVSDLERLRKAPRPPSGRNMVKSLDRVAEVAGLGVGALGLDAVPHRRVVELARWGMAGTATALRRHRRSRKLATMLATVVYLEAKATDDTLEMFDVLMTTDLLARAERESKKEKLRRYPRLSKDAAKCAAAVEVMLASTEWGEEITIELLWDAIESVVSRAELRTAVTNLTDVIPPPDADPNGDWRATLVTRFAAVRGFLPLLNEVVAFGGTAPSNFVHHLVAPYSELAQQVAKDPYNFEFLGLTGEVAERDLENALTSRITETLRELGPGFSFVGRHVHFDVDGDDFYVDLLFFHIEQLRFNCTNRSPGLRPEFALAA